MKTICTAAAAAAAAAWQNTVGIYEIVYVGAVGEFLKGEALRCTNAWKEGEGNREREGAREKERARNETSVLGKNELQERWKYGIRLRGKEIRGKRDG